ncbi:hypothetical protein QVD17_28544 [Tagetes erecta]|uniref:Uncharacterized protein n=1 Tax=Tagetes erecta TaxID=13708 RepID=A0AAD8KAL9_TARER|nr:hypothetical protein QVD17_28544 [Tagetes erecta]
MIGEAMAVVVVRLMLDMSVIIINDRDEGPKDIQRKRKLLPRTPFRHHHRSALIRHVFFYESNCFACLMDGSNDLETMYQNIYDPSLQLSCMRRTDHAQTLSSADCLFFRRHFIKKGLLRPLPGPDLDQPLLRSSKMFSPPLLLQMSADVVRRL